MRKTIVAAIAIAVICLSASSARAGLDDSSVPETGATIDQLKVVFVAMDRDSDGKVGGLQEIFTANGDGSELRQVTSADDGNFYDWAVWAFNGTKIVYTQRVGEKPGAEEAIWMMDPDGKGRQKLTSNPWRNAQPKVSPDGRWLVFTSTWAEAPELAIFRMDLLTLAVKNITSRGGGRYAFESDPSIGDDGSSILFAYSGGRKSETTAPTQVWWMKADGTGARPVTTDRYYNTDPVLSADGRFVAISSFRGLGIPRHAWPPQSASDVFLQDWILAVRDLVTGKERTLTRGLRCDDPRISCAAGDGPAWVPKWSPDSKQIGYLTIRSPQLSGIAVVDADGTNARPLIELPGRAITWWDWTDGRKTAPAGAAARVGTAQAKARLLYTASVYGDLAKADKKPGASIHAAGADGWGATEIVPGLAGIVPDKARWTPDRTHILFTARVKFDRESPSFTPAPPIGEERRTHFTLPEFSTLADTFDAPRESGDVAEEQLFIMRSDGTDVRQLTTPWTEDYMDAIVSGDARGNTEGDVSPDGRYVVFTSLSTLTQESFILRMDLLTGEVINLTNVTAGAIPVADSSPRFSPDGSQIAFSSAAMGGSHVYVMRSDGTGVRQLSDDDWVNVAPAWSPDGRTLVFSSYRGTASFSDEQAPDQPTIPLKDWFAVTTDVASGESAVLVGAERLILQPQWTPDGTRIAFIGLGPTDQPDIFVVGRDGSDLHAPQPTLLSKESSFDWR